jgi:hypothetical protein
MLHPSMTAVGVPSAPGLSQSISSLHGWSDGDPLYGDFVGHPMQGSATGFSWTQKTRRVRTECGLLVKPATHVRVHVTVQYRM